MIPATAPLRPLPSALADCPAEYQDPQLAAALGNEADARAAFAAAADAADRAQRALDAALADGGVLPSKLRPLREKAGDAQHAVTLARRVHAEALLEAARVAAPSLAQWRAANETAHAAMIKRLVEGASAAGFQHPTGRPLDPAFDMAVVMGHLRHPALAAARNAGSVVNEYASGLAAVIARLDDDLAAAERAVRDALACPVA
jgi:hypothetical protein